MSRQKQILLFVTVLVLLTGALLLFSYTTAPLYPNSYGVDSAFNRFMGLMVRRGKTLYSEIWDNKGPVLFWLQALGTLKGTHNADITLTFLMQVLSLFLTMFFLFRAGLTVNGKKQKLLWTIALVSAGLAVFCKTTEGGNLSEEWSLPIISCSLFLLVKYAAKVQDEMLHPRRYAFLHGLCIGLLAFIRINNAISICAGLLAVAVYLMRQKKWRSLLENILFGVLGILTAAVPIFVHFHLRHALGDMLYAVFAYNLKYAAQRTHKSFSGTEFWARYLPMIASLIIMGIHLIRSRRFQLLDGIVLSIVVMNTAMLWSSNIFLHYFTIYFPVFLLVLLLYADYPKIPELLCALLVFGFFLSEDIKISADLPGLREAPDRFAFAASIPEEEKGASMVLYASPEAYLNSGLIPCSRFAAYHFAHFPVDPAMKAEFLDGMLKDPPNWIVYLGGYEPVIPEIYELLEERYEFVTEEYGIDYYRLN